MRPFQQGSRGVVLSEAALSKRPRTPLRAAARHRPNPSVIKVASAADLSKYKSACVIHSHHRRVTPNAASTSPALVGKQGSRRLSAAPPTPRLLDRDSAKIRAK
jgi:hypothetical protein